MEQTNKYVMNGKEMTEQEFLFMLPPEHYASTRNALDLLLSENRYAWFQYEKQYSPHPMQFALTIILGFILGFVVAIFFGPKGF